MVKQCSKRVVYFDFLRAIGAFAIIMIHCDPLSYSEHSTATWIVRTFLNSACRWGVPTFFMISGALFLGSTSSIKKLYLHNILRVVIALFFWSAIYAVFHESIDRYGLIDMVIKFLRGHYHEWFLFIIIELYIMVPVLRKIVISERCTIYFLIVTFVVGSLIPQFLSALSLVSSKLSGVLSDSLTKFEFNFSYVFLFVLGYYLNNTVITRKWRSIIYAVGLISFLEMFVGTLIATELNGGYTTILQNPKAVAATCFSIAVFVFTKQHFSHITISEKVFVVIQKLSKYSFGAYLVHPLVIEVFDYFIGKATFGSFGVFSLPIFTIFVATISFLISAILNKIPRISKYIC